MPCSSRCNHGFLCWRRIFLGGPTERLAARVQDLVSSNGQWRHVYSLSSMQPSCSLDVDRAEDLTADPIPTTPKQEALRNVEGG